jgi:glycerophosphoryl diester phosphodiesterase
MRPVVMVACCAAAACSYRFERTEAWSKPSERNLHVAHALGAVDGVTYSNSLEALQTSTKNGLRWLEVDLHLTADGDLVCFHAGDEAKIGLADQTVDEVSTRDFLRRKYRGRYSSMSFEQLLRRVQGLPDVILVTDTKEWEGDEVDAFIRHVASVDPGLVRRIVPQIYKRREVRYVNRMQRELGDFHSLIWTLYRVKKMSPEDVVAWVAEAGIPIVTMRKTRVTETFIRDLHAAGAVVLAHTVNDPTEIASLEALGVDGVYTDSYVPPAAARERE